MTTISKVYRCRLSVLWLIVVMCFGLGSRAYAQCSNPANAIVAENCLPGNPDSEWNLQSNNSGDSTIQGFATDISVNVGGTVAFKISTPAKAYTINIYRIGYYGGMGARKVATITPSAPLPQTQPACLTNTSTGLIDCGNWGVSATWQVPTTAVSGVYIVHLVRNDTGGDSHIIFIVRNDASHSAILYQTSDETWQAYNYYGQGSLYGGNTPNFGLSIRSYKVSYNRPFLTRGFQEESDTWFFGAEFAMVQWLEQNGYDVTYFTGVDAARSGSLIKNHKMFMDTGHDEYWSGPHRASVQAARDAGVNLAFFTGNEMFWKTRWENSTDGTNTPYRTLVCYKETLAFATIDPNDPPTWTGTWRDPSFSPPADGGVPENGLTGTLFMVNGTGPDNDGSLALKVPSADGKMRFWRNTAVATLAPTATYTMPKGTLGYEWDEDIDNGSRPAGLFHLSTTTQNLTTDRLLDFGATYGAGVSTHNMTMYRAPSGALVFSSGTIDWSWGLNSNHDNPFNFNTPSADANMQQATVNLFADMGVQPATLQSGLLPATASTDTTAPTSKITSPASGAKLTTGTAVTVTGTATDAGGAVAGVEVSGDGGTTWHPATGRSSWSYSFTPKVTGQTTLISRAVDDSANLENPQDAVPITVAPQTCPCGVWSTSNVPGTVDSGDNGSVELGMKFRADADGSVLGVRFYKASTNTGTHVGHLWTDSGTLLATATFTGESGSGWQQVNFSSPVAITANTVYIVSYYAPNGHYSDDSYTFLQSGVDNPPLHALANGADGPNEVFFYTQSASGGFPNQSNNLAGNFWVDLVYTSSNTYALSGVVSGPGGAGATVNLTGTESLSTTTDSSGNYAFDGIPNGTYTVTPTRGGVTYSPTSTSVTINGTAKSGVNFSSTVTNPLSISGTISAGGGATVVLSGAASATTTADTSGNYAFTGLLGGSYTVTPTEPGILFTPGTQSVTLSGTNATQVNFQAQTCNCTTIFQPSATPAVIDANDGTPVEVGLKFRSDTNGLVTGVRFYKAPTNTGTHLGHLWTSTGNQLGSVTFTGESASGWQQATFSSPISVTAGTTYIVSYYAPAGHYSADTSYFASAGVDNAPLHALANGVDGPNGVYLYASSPGGFPSNTYSSTNYWVDVLFTSSQSYTISGKISGASGPGASLTLSGAATATTSADASGNYAFTGVYGGAYTVSPNTIGVSPAAQSVSVAGNVSGVNFSTPALCPCNTVWAPSVKPTTADSNDTASIEVGTKFTADYDGYVLGVRFYKAATNTGPHIGNLWSTAGSGSLLATANAATEGASGWQQITFANPVPVAAKTTYLASYFTQSGHYADDSLFFASAGVDNAPLHALVNGTSGANGVFLYTPSSAYPTNSYNSSNYWVDVLYAKAISYAVNGTVSGSSGPGTTLTLTGTSSATATADSSGNYSFNGLANGTYTVTPTKAGINFSPASQTVTINGAHALAVNFTAAGVSYTVSGTVAGAPNDSIVLSGSTTLNTVTDASGNYAFTSVANGSYTVTPGTAGFAVSPQSQNVTVNGANVSSVNFTATAQTFTIAGTITGGAGATVTLGGSATQSTTADGSGNYSFLGFPNGSYTITPAKTGLVFTPTNITATVQGSSITNANFSITANCPCDTIWVPSTLPGTVDSGDTHAGEYGVKFRADNDGYIAGIRFYKSVANTGTHVGDLWSSTGTPLGSASFSNESASGWQQMLFAKPIPVVANTTYVASYLTQMGHYSADAGFFTSNGVDTPPLHALANGIDGTNGIYTYGTTSTFPLTSFNAANYWVDVVYLPTTTYSISGTLSGAAAAGATVALSGAATATTTADSSGNFAFSGLANGTYTVTPRASGGNFSPASQNVTINNGHALGLTFTSSTQSYTLSGTISGAGGASATVNLTGAATATTSANASGGYTFTGLANGAYTVTPVKTGYTMTPVNQAVTIKGANATANFSSAVAATYTLSGIISGAGGSTATVNLTGATTATVTANTSGVYTFTGLANGSYTVTPVKTGYTMTPVSAAVTINGANATANFASAAAKTYTLTGTISGAGRSGATVKLTGAATSTATTNTSGAYSFTGLLNGSYTVTPTKTGYTMTPTSTAVSVSGANATANFSSAALPTYTLSGTISGGGGFLATVKLTGAMTTSTTTNFFGAYSFTGLVNGSYTVTPAKSGYSMTPVSKTATIGNANVSGVNFTSAASRAGITLDSSQSRDGAAAKTTILSPTFATSASDELLLAFVSTDYASGANTTIKSVAGAGLD